MFEKRYLKNQDDFSKWVRGCQEWDHYFSPCSYGFPCVVQWTLTESNSYPIIEYDFETLPDIILQIIKFMPEDIQLSLENPNHKIFENDDSFKKILADKISILLLDSCNV